MSANTNADFERERDKYLAFCHSVYIRACKIQCPKYYHECKGDKWYECELFESILKDEIEWYKKHN